MENPAQPSDLTERGYTGTASTTVQQAWLDVAFRALRRELRLHGVKLEESIDPGDVDAILDVVDVVVSATLRSLRNPDGVKSDAGGIDDYNENRTFADATEDIYFTAAEIRRLTPVATGTGWSGSLKYTS